MLKGPEQGVVILTVRPSDGTLFSLRGLSLSLQVNRCLPSLVVPPYGNLAQWHSLFVLQVLQVARTWLLEGPTRLKHCDQ